MKTIRQLVGLYKKEGDVGVEIEVEGWNLPTNLDYWRTEVDGSLRGEESLEYVMATPAPLKQLTEVFQELEEAFSQEGVGFDETYRAGVHVHVNVQELTTVQLFNFVVLYLVLEELLMEYVEKHRRGNHFCLRASDADYLPQLIWRCVEDGNLRHLYTDDIRYSAMNLKPVVAYGSVEFRAHESTRDFDKIKKWAEILVTLRDNSLLFETPRDIMSEVSMGGYDGFITKALGEYAEFFLAVPDWRAKVRKGIWVAQDIAFARDWKAKTKRIFVKGDRDGW